MRRLALVVATVGIGTLLAVARLAGQQTQFYPDVLNEVKHDVSPAMREVRPSAELGRWQVVPLLHPPHEVKQGQEDPVIQQYEDKKEKRTTAILSANGVGSNGAVPSDSNGAAGATQYVQWVNSSYAVFDKATGKMIQAPLPGNSLWTGFGGPCEANNQGDPIVQYDKAANRWVMAQPVFNSPYMYCIAVSTTSDATGAYHRYAFSMPDFPDYPKLAVWPDAFYGSFNLFDSTGNTFFGAYACAFDRNAMLNGSTATAQCFNNPSQASFLPSDLDGSTPPPAGSPNYFVDLNPTSLIALNLYKFHVDFSNSANSTFSGPASIPVAPFTEACSGHVGVCIPQPLVPPNNQQLDSVGDRLMYRLAYRNFGGHESLVVSHSVDTTGTGTGVTGVRWYELRNPGGTPAIYQQGTFAPDASYRWMPSIAMDKAGDIAVGYSVSSSTLHPSIRYAGRVPGDALGTLETETSIVEGTGTQVGESRWGDYTSMAIDPADDCTFWYTNQYLTANGIANWLTQIASFKFPSCGSVPSPDFSLSASPASATVVQGNGAAYSVGVHPLNGFTGSVSFSAGSLPSGVSASFNPTVSSSSTTMSVTTSSSTPAGTYTVAVTGTDGSLSHTVNVTLVVNPLPDFSISAAPSPQSVNRGSSTTYTTSVAASGGFAGTVNLSVSGLPRRTSASFSPSSITGAGTSTLTVSVPKKASAGTYQLTITGTSGALAHSATVILTVN